MVRDWSREVALARAAQTAGQLSVAVGLLLPALSDPSAPDDALRSLAAALRAGDRSAEAIPALEMLVRRRSTSAVAEHNLAAALGDCGRAADSEAAAERALKKGGRAPETSLVLARAQVAQGKLDEAEAAFRLLLASHPDFLPGFREQAQLRWMREGNLESLTSLLEPLTVRARDREDSALLLSSILRDTVGDQAALDVLVPWLMQGSVEATLAAAAAASGFGPALSLDYARRALNLAPSDPRAELAVCSALIACGRPDEAVAGLERRLTRDPGDQYARALLHAAWRTGGDPRALTAEDYQRLVRVYRLGEKTDSKREAWLKQTAVALRRLHPFRSHPFQQSVQNGAQSRIDPRAAGDPDIDHLFDALRGPIDAYIAEVEPAWLSRPAHGPWRISGAWSVKLAAGGRHSDHVHPRAWVSSAVYIETPPEVDAGGRAGWLRFGAARIGAAFSLPAEHWVRPEPGTLVLFPSFLWHGTEPFNGPGERLTVAFDLQPEPPP